MTFGHNPETTVPEAACLFERRRHDLSSDRIEDLGLLAGIRILHHRSFRDPCFRPHGRRRFGFLKTNRWMAHRSGGRRLAHEVGEFGIRLALSMSATTDASYSATSRSTIALTVSIVTSAARYPPISRITASATLRQSSETVEHPASTARCHAAFQMSMPSRIEFIIFSLPVGTDADVFDTGRR